MEVRIADIPDNKTFSDYPKDTEFILDDRPPKYDKKALENNRIIRVMPNENGYENAITKEEAMKLLE